MAGPTGASPATCLLVVRLERHRLRVIGVQKPAHQAQREVVGRHVSEIVIQAVEAWSPDADGEQVAEEKQRTIVQRQEGVVAGSPIEYALLQSAGAEAGRGVSDAEDEIGRAAQSMAGGRLKVGAELRLMLADRFAIVELWRVGWQQRQQRTPARPAHAARGVRAGTVVHLAVLRISGTGLPFEEEEIRASVAEFGERAGSAKEHVVVQVEELPGSPGILCRRISMALELNMGRSSVVSNNAACVTTSTRSLWRSSQAGTSPLVTR